MQGISNGLYRVSVWLVILFSLLLTCSVLLEVFARSIFGISFRWSGELAQYSYVYLTFIGAAAAYKKHELIGFDVLKHKLSPKFKRTFFYLVHVVILCFAAAMLYYGIMKILSPSVMVQKSAGLRLPMFVPFAAIPIGMAMIIFHALTFLLFARRGAGEEK